MKVKTTPVGILAAMVTAVVAIAGSAKAELIYGLTIESELVSFDSATPGMMTTPIPITGVTVGTLQAIDFRPANGQLYGLAFDGSSSIAQVYTIDLATGAATAQGASFILADTGINSYVSIDFNPVADRLRIVAANYGTTNNSTSYRWNPVTNSFVQQDIDILYITGDLNASTNPPAIDAVAYDNNVPGATSTTMYVYDFDINVLGRVGSLGGSPISPNTGELSTIGSSGISANGDVGFDISGLTGIGYIVTTVDEVFNRFYTVNLSTGALSLVGDNEFHLLDISVAPIPEPCTCALFVVGASLLVVLCRRFQPAT